MPDYPDQSLADLYAIDAEFIAALLQQQPQPSDGTKLSTGACQPNNVSVNSDVQLQLVQEQPLQEQPSHDMQQPLQEQLLYDMQQPLYRQQQPQYYLPVQQQTQLNNSSFASLDSLSSVDSYASASTATATGQHHQLVQYGQPVHLQTPPLQQYVYHQSPPLQQSGYYPSPLLVHQLSQQQSFPEQPFQEQQFYEQQFHQQQFQFQEQQFYEQQLHQQQEYQACVSHHSYLQPFVSNQQQLQLYDPQQLVPLPSNEEEQAEGSSSANNSQQVYVRKACQSCKASHVACDIERPCSRCLRLKKGDTCVDAVRKKRGRPAKNAPKDAPNNTYEGDASEGDASKDATTVA